MGIVLLPDQILLHQITKIDSRENYEFCLKMSIPVGEHTRVPLHESNPLLRKPNVIATPGYYLMNKCKLGGYGGYRLCMQAV